MLMLSNNELTKIEKNRKTTNVGKCFFGDNGFQNMFLYQPTFNMLQLKRDTGTEYVIVWKSKGVYSSKIIPL